MPLKYSVVKTEFQSNVLFLEHGDKKLDFDVDAITKDFHEDLFLTINKYLTKLDQETIDKIFTIYSDFYMFKSKHNDFTDKNTVRYLEDTIAELVTLFNLTQFKSWLDWNTTEISFPANIKEEFVFDPDLSVTKEKTYTKKEYQDLVAVILLIRFLLPILAEFYSNIYTIVKYSFYMTFNLLIKSEIFNSVELEKLRVYILEIQTSLSFNNSDQYILLKGLSTDDINEFILAEIIFTKLLFIEYTSSKSNIVSFIFQTIKYKTNFASSDSDAIRSRTLRDDPKKEDLSYFEDYRKTTDISLGTVVEIQHYLDDFKVILKELNLENYFTYEEYHSELEYTYKLSKYSINKTQIILLGWFLHKYINPRALFYIETKKIIELLTFSSIILWNAGMHFMSILMTSNVSNNVGFINNIIKYSLSKEDISLLEKSFSLFIDKEKSIVEDSILAIAKDINGNIWMPNCNNERINIFNEGNAIKHLFIPNDLVKELCVFIDFTIEH